MMVEMLSPLSDFESPNFIYAEEDLKRECAFSLSLQRVVPFVMRNIYSHEAKYNGQKSVFKVHGS